MKWAISLAAVAALSGCVNSGAIKIGPDTYRVTTRVPLSGAAGAEQEALETAGQYCASIQKEILVANTDSGECALHGGCGNSSVTFRCLSPGDPRLSAASK